MTMISLNSVYLLVKLFLVNLPLFSFIMQVIVEVPAICLLQAPVCSSECVVSTGKPNLLATITYDFFFCLGV